MTQSGRTSARMSTKGAIHSDIAFVPGRTDPGFLPAPAERAHRSVLGRAQKRHMSQEFR
ncbi:hypothetical protein PCANC_28078, partial [Puccinia coronata f. sp. avenae]